MTPLGMEGVFTSAILSIATALTEPEDEFHDYLFVFVRDELAAWHMVARKSALESSTLTELVASNVDLIIRKTQGLACQSERTAVSLWSYI